MTEMLLKAKKLSVGFTAGAAHISVVRSISFDIGQEIVALVGESGSGKSLTGRSIMGLLPRTAMLTADELSFQGSDLTKLDATAWNRVRGSEIGLILQDPKYSLNPSQTVGRQVEEALLLHTKLSSAERRERALEMLAHVGLADPLRAYASYPGQLSGGMGQRVMIAAMLINHPKLLIADEPTSALDRDLQNQVLTLLRKLAEEFRMGLLLISHDLQQVSRYADRVIVMRQGTIVERLPASRLAQATDPYTQALWRARPSASTYGTRLPELQDETAGVAA